MKSTSFAKPPQEEVSKALRAEAALESVPSQGEAVSGNPGGGGGTGHQQRRSWVLRQRTNLPRGGSGSAHKTERRQKVQNLGGGGKNKMQGNKNWDRKKKGNQPKTGNNE